MYHMDELRLVESIKLKVSLAEYSLFYRAFLQKRPIIPKPNIHINTCLVTYAESCG